jgi:molybdopterin synthase catalytic subunit
MGERAISDDWIAITDGPLPVAEALGWAVTPSCGAVVTFSGTVRDHSPGRPAVRLLEYEAYLEPAIERLGRVAAEARRRWPDIGRLALLHRTGALEVTETAVVVVVSTPSRPEGFAAARFCIDTLKATVPIWKRETWEGGTEWSGVGVTEPDRAPGFVLDLHPVDAHSDHDHDHDHAERAGHDAAVAERS